MEMIPTLFDWHHSKHILEFLSRRRGDRTNVVSRRNESLKFRANHLPGLPDTVYVTNQEKATEWYALLSLVIFEGLY